MLIDPASEALEVNGRHALRVTIEMESAADMKRIVGELALKDGAAASRPGETELDGAWRDPVSAFARRAHIQRPVTRAWTSSNNTARAM